MLSASGGFAPRPPPGLCPWTPLGDFRPPDPLILPPPGKNPAGAHGGSICPTWWKRRDSWKYTTDTTGYCSQRQYTWYQASLQLKNSTSYGQISSKPKPRPRIVESKAWGLRGQGHKILSSRCPRGWGQSSRTPSLMNSRPIMKYSTVHCFDD